MTYIAVARAAALQESMALRAFARQGRTPRCAPVDRWAAWCDHLAHQEEQRGRWRRQATRRRQRARGVAA